MRPRTAVAVAAHQRARPGTDEQHLLATVDWIERAQDATGTGGVAARFDLALGWDAPYPETTGYIIGSLLHEWQRTGETVLLDRTIRMGDWLASTQHDDGFIPGGLLRPDRAGRPEVFNTGQVLYGWLALFEVTGEVRFEVAARRAATWLADVQDDDGAWRRHSLHGAAHAYYARVTWALARSAKVLDDDRHLGAASRSVEWLCSQQTSNGWIDHMSFTDGSDPLTHTIAYTIEGLLETGRLLGLPEAWDAGRRALSAMAESVRIRPTGRDLSATFKSDWSPSASYSCVVGNAQLALCCQRVDAIEPDPVLRQWADELVESVKRAQVLDGPDGIRGGIPGSAPLWGDYGSFKYLNWGAKFVIDVLHDRVVAGRLPLDRFG